jgi:AcrR family transcriptional regulator
LIVKNPKRHIEPSSPAVVGDLRHARGQNTRELLLQTAERLFAELGIAAVSLRDIGGAAGQKNNAVVYYHFGNKENLVKAIVLYRVQEIRKSSTAFQKVLAGKRSPKLRDLINVFVAPFGNIIPHGTYYIPFLSRYIAEHGSTSELIETATANQLNGLKASIGDLLEGYPASTIDERWDIFTESVIHSLARYQTAHRDGTLSKPLEALLEDLVSYHTSGFQAPQSDHRKSPAARVG